MPSKQPIAELLNKKFGRLKILADAEKAGKKRMVTALCDCGILKDYMLESIKSGNTLSCGCLITDVNTERMTIHGLRHTKIYEMWKGFKARCSNPKHISYKHYGAKGVKVCDEWSNDFMSFYNWAMNNGYKEGLSLDRFPNKDGIYEPSNCRWANQTQQMRNSSRARMIEFNGEIKCISEWSEILGIPYARLQQRITKQKLPIEKAFTL